MLLPLTLPRSEYGCYRQRHQGCRFHSEGKGGNVFAFLDSISSIDASNILWFFFCLLFITFRSITVFGTFEEDRKGVASSFVLYIFPIFAALRIPCFIRRRFPFLNGWTPLRPPLLTSSLLMMRTGECFASPFHGHLLVSCILISEL